MGGIPCCFSASKSLISLLHRKSFRVLSQVCKVEPRANFGTAVSWRWSPTATGSWSMAKCQRCIAFSAPESTLKSNLFAIGYHRISQIYKGGGRIQSLQKGHANHVDSWAEYLLADLSLIQSHWCGIQQSLRWISPDVVQVVLKPSSTKSRKGIFCLFWSLIRWCFVSVCPGEWPIPKPNCRYLPDPDLPEDLHPGVRIRRQRRAHAGTPKSWTTQNLQIVRFWVDEIWWNQLLNRSHLAWSSTLTFLLGC